MRVASRYLLPLEMFLACQLIVMAINGGFGGGTMYKALMAAGETWAWFLLIAPIGIALGVIATYEWCFLRGAALYIIRRLVSARATCAFLGTITWLAAAIFIASIGAAPVTTYFMLTAPVAAAFHAWCFVENMKVKWALDDRYPTPNLRFHR